MGSTVLGNSIFGDTELGIDLADDGVTPNDGARNLNAPNDDMDDPVFTSAVLTGSTLTVAGYVGSAPGQATFAGSRVEIFRADNDATGYGEGRSSSARSPPTSMATSRAASPAPR